MGKKYICEVKRDNTNFELELVNTNNFNTVPSSTSEGGIQFSDRNEMQRYFDRYCISEDKLGNGGGIFVFLFFLLLLIFLVILINQMFNKSGPGVASTVRKTSFGRFSF